MTDQQMVCTGNAHEYDFESGFVEPVIGAPDVHAVVDMDESASDNSHYPVAGSMTTFGAY